ncbi:SoxR reducing system RseC family protein [Oscillospiraceae bacterium OttesenSCG-928-G22]|nr:SoxR reducing system RseC family protein [Oscillospiraceae bacterium OttesenSCG-928-G22]
MTQVARIGRALPGGYCEIHVERESACGGKCGECKGCAMRSEIVTVRAKNSANLRAGTYGVVETKTGVVLGTAAIYYILPVVLFFVGYFLAFSFTKSDAVSIGAGVALFLLSMLGAVILGRRTKGVSFEVVASAPSPTEEG